mgnify:CR=1 FL=1
MPERFLDNLIVDKKQVYEFCDIVLPELKDDEVLIAVLVSRKKYCPELTRSEEALAKLILKDSDKQYVYRKLKRFGYVEDVFVDYKTGNPVSHKCMAMYIDVQPMSAMKGFKTFNAEIIDLIYQTMVNPSVKRDFRNLDTKLFSAINRSRSRKPYYIVDIDVKDEKLLNKILEVLSEDAVWVSETRGGYHVIANNDNPYNRIYSKVNKKTNQREIIDYKTHEVIFSEPESRLIEVIYHQAQTPVPGSLQGGFVVKGDKP